MPNGQNYCVYSGTCQISSEDIFWLIKDRKMTTYERLIVKISNTGSFEQESKRERDIQPYETLYKGI